MFDRYETRCEEFLTALARERYLTGSGQKPTLEVKAIYLTYADLFERDQVGELLERRGEDRRQRYLAAFAALGYLERQVVALTEMIANAELAATVTCRGETLPLRAVPARIANEPDAHRRHDWERAAATITAQQNPHRQERLALQHEVAREIAKSLGLAADREVYTAICDDLKTLNLQWLTAQMPPFLEATEDVFLSRQSDYLDDLGVSHKEATNADLSRLFRAPEYDPLFPKEKMAATLTRFLAGLGFRLERQKNLELDIEPRPLKSPRAFCAGIRIPQEVKLVINPKGGPDDYRALFHEAGHAQHFANVDAHRPFAFRRLGDSSVTEMYAFLFDNLMHNERWLRDCLGVRDPGYRRLALFYKLRILRRYAAKLLYERELHAATLLQDMAESYVMHLGRALGVHIQPELFLSDVDDNYYVANYLRAWIAEAQVRHFLEKEWGDGWFARKEAGTFLYDWWRLGFELPVEELLRQIGEPGLNVEPIQREVTGD